jgi:hypothetical protein
VKIGEGFLSIGTAIFGCFAALQFKFLKAFNGFNLNV